MAAIDLEIINLPYHRSVQYQMAGITFLIVYGAREPVSDYLLDADTTESVATLNRDDWLTEYLLADRADERRRLFHELSRLGRHG